MNTGKSSRKTVKRAGADHSATNKTDVTSGNAPNLEHVLDYITQASSTMRSMCMECDEMFLAYLLEMAALESAQKLEQIRKKAG